MAYTDKPQKIVASAINSANDENTKFRVTLGDGLKLDPGRQWVMACVQSIIPAREIVQFAKHLWFKRISSPFASQSATFKNQFNAENDFGHKYNYLFNMGIAAKDWFGEQSMFPQIHLNSTEALSWPNTGNWDLTKVNAFLNSKFYLKFDFLSWKDGLGTWPQDSIIYLEEKKGEGYFDLGFKGVELQPNMGFVASQQFMTCRFSRMLVEFLGIDNWSEDYFPSAVKEYHDVFVAQYGNTVRNFWKYMKNNHPTALYGYYIIGRNYVKGSDIKFESDYLDIFFWTKLPAGKTSIAYYDSGWPAPSYKGMKRGIPMNCAKHLFTQLPEAYSLNCDIIEQNFASGHLAKSLANLFLQFKINGYKRSPYISQVTEFRELAFSNLQTRQFQTFWLEIVPNPVDKDSANQIVHSHCRVKVGGDTIVVLYLTPQ